MIEFVKAVKNVLQDKNREIKVLFDDKVVSPNTFYKYNTRYPSLKTLIKIVNYLEVSLDYLFEFEYENVFKKYNIENLNFYKNLEHYIKAKKISGRKFCRDLNYSKDNLKRWQNGTMPSVETLFELTKYFNCTIDELIL